MFRAVTSDVLQRFRQDAARWVVPERVGDADALTPRTIAVLLWRHPSLRAMAWFRLGTWAHALGIRGVGVLCQHQIFRRYGLEISPTRKVGGGLYIAHPVGCVLHARMGSNVTVVGQVTFGTRGDSGWPIISDGAFLGVGARVLGGVTIGAGARIGANAVVLIDVEPGATAVGVPARVVKSGPAPKSSTAL